MDNTFVWPIIRLVQRLCMILTLACFTYAILFLFSKNHDDSLSENMNVAPKRVALPPPAAIFDLKPYDASADPQSRDVFSMNTAVGPSGAVENTPRGQLPNHLKIVGIVIADPSQIIIEDSFSNTTYFIDQDHTQDGIKLMGVDKNQMTINYQGQNISVPITKS